MAPGEVGTGEHGGQDDLAKVLAALRPVECCQALPEAVDGATIVTLGLVGVAEALVRLRLQDAPHWPWRVRGALGGGDGLVIRAHEAEMLVTERARPGQATRVVEGFREGLGLAQIRQDTPQVARRPERRAQGDPEINGLLVVALSPADVGGH